MGEPHAEPNSHGKARSVLAHCTCGQPRRKEFQIEVQPIREPFWVPGQDDAVKAPKSLGVAAVVSSQTRPAMAAPLDKPISVLSRADPNYTKRERSTTGILEFLTHLLRLTPRCREPAGAAGLAKRSAHPAATNAFCCHFKMRTTDGRLLRHTSVCRLALGTDK